MHSRSFRSLTLSSTKLCTSRCRRIGPSSVSVKSASGTINGHTRFLTVPTAKEGVAASRVFCTAVHRQSRPHAAGNPQKQYDWPGLQLWRESGVDSRRHWGDTGPTAVAYSAEGGKEPSLATYATKVLLTADPLQKATLSHHAWQQFRTGQMPVGTSEPPAQPARPSSPKLVPQKQVPSPKQSPLPLPVYMLHNLAHVELNAIDLAWDTVARFSALKLDQSFYADFARVADDESRHLGWCLQRLKELGHAYGDMVAHNMLWEGAQASSGDLAGRLAVVPMSQEARGLDAGPRLAERLVGCGDNRTAAIVARIALEEKAHVAVGVSWFTKLSAAMGEDPGRVFQHCITSLGQQDVLKPPYNHASRQEVGLQQQWYDRTLWLENLPAVQSTDKPKDLKHDTSAASRQHLRHRMAAMLDMEATAAA